MSLKSNSKFSEKIQATFEIFFLHIFLKIIWETHVQQILNMSWEFKNMLLMF